MNLFEQIDIYCERTDASFLSEPINLVTNLSFIFVAVWCARQWHRVPPANRLAFQALTILVFTIGLGSAAFHSFANGLSKLADVIPISAFLVGFIGVMARQVGKFSWLKVGAVFLLFGTLTFFLSKMVSTELANGSNLYFGTFAMLFVMGFYFRPQDKPIGTYLYAAGTIFGLALTCRTIDMSFCDQNAWGTHFLWHLFNGGVIYFAMAALLSGFQWRWASRDLDNN